MRTAPSIGVAAPDVLFLVPGNLDILVSAAAVEPSATVNRIEIQQGPPVPLGAFHHLTAYANFFASLTEPDGQSQCLLLRRFLNSRYWPIAVRHTAVPPVF
jgi:hypothetical protein